jgi:hypothetical protein
MALRQPAPGQNFDRIPRSSLQHEGDYLVPVNFHREGPTRAIDRRLSVDQRYAPDQTCGPGGYDSNCPGQVGLRDAEINASAFACP